MRMCTWVAAVMALTLPVEAATARTQQAAPGQQAPAGGAPAPAGQSPPAGATAAPAVPGAITPPSDYVIGVDDVLAVVFWREKELSAIDIVVRPDGKITLPLVNDIQAAGFTPEQLRQRIEEAANKFVQDPTATVVVKQINSRKLYITGMVGKPGPYALSSPTTILQALAMAGGLAEFAKKDKIVVMRTEAGQTKTFKFNYKDVLNGKNLQQNILLKPGDTIVVP